MDLKRQQIGNIFCLAGVRQENAESIGKIMGKPLLFLFIVIKYNHNKERGGLVWLMQ